MFTEIPTAPETTSISFKSGWLELVNKITEVSAYKNRSDFVHKACQKQIVYQTKAIDIYKILKATHGLKIDIGDTVEVTTKIPKELYDFLNKHCHSYACDMTIQFFIIAVLKYWLMKEAPTEFFNELYRMMYEPGNTDVYKAIVT